MILVLVSVLAVLLIDAMFVAEALALMNCKDIIVHDRCIYIRTIKHYRCISTIFLTYQKAKQDSMSLTTGAIKLIYELSVRFNTIVLLNSLVIELLKVR